MSKKKNDKKKSGMDLDTYVKVLIFLTAAINLLTSVVNLYLTFSN